MNHLYKYLDKYKKDLEGHRKFAELHYQSIKNLKRQIKPLITIIEKTLPTFDSKKYIKNQKWLELKSVNFINTLNPQYFIFKSFNSTFFNLIEEATRYQKNWQWSLEIINRNISGLGSQILHDVINIDEYVKVEISEAVTAKELSLNDLIQQTLSEILNKVDELVESNQTKPIIQNGWVQLFLNIIVGIFIGLFLASQNDEFIKEQFLEQEVLITDGIKQINERIDTISNKTDWRAYIVNRPIKVRIKDCFKSTKIADLFAGEKVNVIKIDGKWAYIEFFDFNTGLLKYGWVPKKYLKSADKN